MDSKFGGLRQTYCPFYLCQTYVLLDKNLNRNSLNTLKDNISNKNLSPLRWTRKLEKGKTEQGNLQSWGPMHPLLAQRCRSLLLNLRYIDNVWQWFSLFFNTSGTSDALWNDERSN